MQLKYFTDGGYVVHKALGRHISAWFTNDGQIKDAELIDRLGRSRPVKPDSALWGQLQSAYGGKENFEEWHKPYCNHNQGQQSSRIS